MISPECQRNPSGATASARSGNRANSRSKATRPSNRASGAPRQKWMPWPRARFPPSLRLRSDRVAIRGGEDRQHRLTGRDRGARDCDRLGGEPPGAELDRSVEAQQLLNGGLHQTWVRLELRELVRMCEQGEGPVADQVDRGFEAGEQQDERHGGGFVLGQVLAVVRGADERGEQVVLGRVGGQDEPLLVNELLEIATHPLDRAADPAARTAAIRHAVRPLVEDRLVLRRYTQHLADHDHRQRERVRPDQIDRLRAERIQQPVRDLDHPRLEVRDSARRERLRHQPAQPSVVRRIEVEQVRRDA